MSHVPGPWRAVGRRVVADTAQFGGSTVVCIVSEDEHGKAEAEGTAALIACAPDMLRMLIEIDNENWDFTYGEVEDLIKRAGGK